MPNRARRPPNIVAPITGQAPPGRATAQSERERWSTIAAELGRRGGLKGGKARAAALSERRKRAIARKAARARWAKRPAEP